MGSRDRKVRVVFRADALMGDCHVAGNVAYCVKETATRPAHIIAVNLDSGSERVLADPNPSFLAKKFPNIRKIALKMLTETSDLPTLCIPEITTLKRDTRS